MMEIIRGAIKGRDWLKENQFPYSDEIALRCSNKEFPNKSGQYGFEIPAVNTLQMLESLISALKKEGIFHVRFDETHGSCLLPESELKEMLALCVENDCGITFSTGPRPEYDRKASFYRTTFGMEQGRRLNNNDAIACTIDEVFRLVDFGCRGIIVYDLGVLYLLNKMRESGVFPREVLFIVSTHCMVTNSLTAKVYAEHGADNIVAPHDLGLAVLQEMRNVLPETISISVPIDMYHSKGGFMRYGEIPELIQIVSPVFLKLGASAQSHPYDAINQGVIDKKINRVLIAIDHLRRSKLHAKYLDKTSIHWSIPKIKIT